MILAGKSQSEAHRGSWSGTVACQTGRMSLGRRVRCNQRTSKETHRNRNRWSDAVSLAFETESCTLQHSLLTAFDWQRTTESLEQPVACRHPNQRYCVVGNVFLLVVDRNERPMTSVTDRHEGQWFTEDVGHHTCTTSDPVSIWHTIVTCTLRFAAAVNT